MIGIMLRLAGSICIVGGTSFYGIWMSRRYAGRLEELEELRHMIFLLKGQILYANAPLQEAFDTVGRRTKGELSKFFIGVAERMNQQSGEVFSVIWDKAVDQMSPDALLSKSDREKLKHLGTHLGFLDREMQERNLLLYLEELDLRIQDMRDHRQERCRLYSSLGVMSGLFLTILLI